MRPQLEKRSSACKARHAFILYNIDTATTADTFRLGLRVLSVCSCGVWRNKEACFFIALAFSLKRAGFYVPQRSSPNIVLGVLGPNVTDAWVHVVDMWSQVLGIVVISEGASEKRCRQQKKTSKLIEQINIKSLTSVFLTASVVVGFAKWQNRAWSHTNLNTFCSAKVACKKNSPCLYDHKHGLHQRCTISIFHHQFNINYSGYLLINSDFNFNYFKEGLSISIPYQFFKKFLYQFQYQFIVSMSYYDIDKITNFLSISHCSQYQYWYQLMNKGLININ